MDKKGIRTAEEIFKILYRAAVPVMGSRRAAIVAVKTTTKVWKAQYGN